MSNPHPTARRIVDRIIDDLRDRNVLKQAWEGLDFQAKAAIKRRWAEIAAEEIEEGK